MHDTDIYIYLCVCYSCLCVFVCSKKLDVTNVGLFEKYCKDLLYFLLNFVANSNNYSIYTLKQAHITSVIYSASYYFSFWLILVIAVLLYISDNVTFLLSQLPFYLYSEVELASMACALSCVLCVTVSRAIHLWIASCLALVRADTIQYTES